jgi:hypothetical protein
MSSNKNTPPDTLDLDALRLPAGLVATTPSPRRRPPRPKRGEHFLKGPISWSWLARAARLPGKALHVGVAVWRLAGMKKAATVSLSLSGLRDEVGVERDAARRGLEALEKAALVHVERHTGRCPRVTLLPVAADGPVAD